MSVANVVARLNEYFAGAGNGVCDFSTEGVKTDLIAESTSGSGVTIDDVVVKDGGLLCPTSTTGIGYSSGAGGAVTQGTDKGTGVTLSKVCGTITTVNTEITAGSEATFIVTNTTVAITDTVVVAVQSGGTSGEYAAWVSDVGAGTFDITISNMSGSNASDILLINFAVIKGVAA